MNRYRQPIYIHTTANLAIFAQQRLFSPATFPSPFGQIFSRITSRHSDQPTWPLARNSIFSYLLLIIFISEKHTPTNPNSLRMNEIISRTGRLFTVVLLPFLLFHSTVEMVAAPVAGKKKNHIAGFRSDCAEARTSTDLAINNVRARLWAGGDFWWDPDGKGYIVPAHPPVSGRPQVSAISGGSVWIGGYDGGGNLRLAANTHRSGGRTDFWPGPLDPDGETGAEVCNNWDRLFEVTVEDLTFHDRSFWRSFLDPSADRYELEDIPQSILGWPAAGNPYFRDIHDFDLPENHSALAPFIDWDGDDRYDPLKGDRPLHPAFLNFCIDNFHLDPSGTMFFWMYNDNGSVHSSSGGRSMMTEIRATAFAFRTDDEANDMLFQTHLVTNRSPQPFSNTYMSLWVNPDLGCPSDDYVGVDTFMRMAYVYNQDATDGLTGCECNGTATYCEDIPLVGFRFIHSPSETRDWNNTITSFIYYNNSQTGNPAMNNPTAAEHFYNYMRGRWKDGTPLTYGGDGYDPSGREVSYAFPSAPDSKGPSAWSMCTANLPADDRCMVMSSGPFDMRPGQVEELTFMVSYVPAAKHPCPDIRYLKTLQYFADGIFFHCPDLLDIVMPPDLDVIEDDQQLLLLLSNHESSNNHREEYAVFGFDWLPELISDPYYRFEGYEIYQLRNRGTKRSDLADPDKARLIHQCDIRNDVSDIFNWSFIPDPDRLKNTYGPRLMVSGQNQGIRHVFTVSEDAFNPGQSLENDREYYFAAIAYAHNDYYPFDPELNIGQTSAYYPSHHFSIVSGTPRRQNRPGDMVRTGDGMEVTRLDGTGNGGNYLHIKDPIDDAVLNGTFPGPIRYKRGLGPLEVKVIDPDKVPRTDLEVSFRSPGETALVLPATRVYIKDLGTQALVDSSVQIGQPNELILRDYGISIYFHQPDSVGSGRDRNGAIGATIRYKDAQGPQWLSGLSDTLLSIGHLIPGAGPEHVYPLHFIKNRPGEEDHDLDPAGAFHRIGEGYFAPMYVMDFRYSPTSFMISPMVVDNDFGHSLRSRVLPGNLNNIDLVLTPDRSKWSRCVVTQAASLHYSLSGLAPADGTRMFDHRRSPSLGIDGRYATSDGTINGTPLTTASDDPNDPNYIWPMGMSWFPGYAIDVECGTRVNVFFSENSVYDESYQHLYEDSKTIGNDMIWNPSAQLALDGQDIPLNTYFGGQHFIYLTNQPYDGCSFIRGRLDPGRNYLWKREAFNYFTWAGIPMTAPGHKLLSYAEGLIPNETRIELRVNSQYGTRCGTGVNNGLPHYLVHLDPQAPVTSLDQDISGVGNTWQNATVNSYSGALLLPFSPDRYTLRVFSLTGQLLHEQKGHGPIAAGSVDGRYELDWNSDDSFGRYPCGVYIIHLDAGAYGSQAFKWLLIHKC